MNQRKFSMDFAFGSKKSMSEPQSIFLLSNSCKFNAFKYLPRQFTVTTNNSSGKFNTFILSKASSNITTFLLENPNESQYHINVQDENNIIGKIEQLFQGETVSFTDADILIANKIKKHLHLSVNLIKTTVNSLFHSNTAHTKPNSSNINVFNDLELFTQQSSKSRYNFNRNYGESTPFVKSLPVFTIKTKKKDYICNIVGVRSSSVISDFILKNPDETVFNYDYEDDQSEFQIICDLFNFSKIELTREKAEIIKEIGDDLGIDCISGFIEIFFESIEKVSQTIDDQQSIIDTIDELFYLLYHIKEKSAETVALMIARSNWSKTKESVLELAAFIFQVINADVLIHPYLIDLLIELDANQHKNNQLKILVPFIANRLLSLFTMDTKYIDNNADLSFAYPFIFRMYKKGLISQELLFSKLKNCPINSSLLVSWFFPELVENNPELKDYILIDDNVQLYIKIERMNINLLYPCNPKQIEKYKRMRDKLEYDNEIAVALRNDDVDTFQSIVTKSGEKSLKEKLRKNIFEPIFKRNPRYLNYAAAYGSIKCFKYLLLNDEKIDDFTFELAIIGGDNEIIRIVDNDRKKIERSEVNPQTLRRKTMKNEKDFFNLNPLIQSIKRHKNELFDWALEQQIEEISQNEGMDNLVICSIENGNAHSLVQLIDNGFNFHTSQNKYRRFLEIASEKGFYLLDNLLLNLINKTPNQEIPLDPKTTVVYGNILIFMLFDKYMKQSDLEIALIKCIELDMMVFVVYFFEILINNSFKLDNRNVVRILDSAIRIDTNYIFNYLINVIDYLQPLSIVSLRTILIDTFDCKNIEASKKIIDLIYTKNKYNDFTSLFVQALKTNFKEVIEYLVDKKYYVLYEYLPEKIINICHINVDIFSLIMDNVDQSIKKKLIGYISKAINEINKPLVQYLLNQGALLDTSLIEAVKANDIELVEMILKKNSSPSFINQISNDGSALHLSVKNSNLQIFKKLISIPGINPSIYHKKFETPLILSASKLNEDVFYALIEFYGDDIKNQKWQLEKALISITEQNQKSITNDAQIRMIIKILDMNIIDPNFRIVDDTLLTYSCKINAIKIVESLLKYDSIDVNMCESENGDTPLIVSVAKYSFKIVKLLLNHPKIDINKKNYIGKSALVYASQLKWKEIIQLLLDNEKFDPMESNINLAFYGSNFEIMKMFLSFECLDVNYTPLYENLDPEYYPITDVDSIIRNKLIETIVKKDITSFDLLINHPSFDKSESQIRNALYISLLENEYEIFEKILSMYDGIDINSHIYNGNSLLIEAVIGHKKDKPIEIEYSDLPIQLIKTKVKNKRKNNFVESILNYKNFDSEKSDISHAFVLSVMDNSHNKESGSYLMDILYDYDCKHLHIIDSTIKKKGSSLMVSNIGYNPNFVYFINFLIDHGVDPNEPDENGVYPFEKAIQFSRNTVTLSDLKPESILENNKKYMNKSIAFYFINSNKIDFTKQIINKNGDSEFTTYLHIAAGLGRLDIIAELVSRKLCDINVTNDFGETPLFEACKMNKVECIKFLFMFDDLDFLHRNNKGEDAVQFLKNRNNNDDKNSKDEKKVDLSDKNVYLKQLLMNLKQSKKFYPNLHFNRNNF